MFIVRSIFLFITYGTIAIIVAAIVLILLRSLFNYLDVNPFNWSALTVRRLTDPVVLPVRRMLIASRVDPVAAPLIAILLIILVGYFVVQIFGSALSALAGIMSATLSGSPSAPVAVIGYLLYGFLGLYKLVIFIRIICSWFAVSYANRLMRFVFRSTEPLLAPLRRTIPPVGMFDISPIVAFLILWLLQAAVAGTLLRGWPVESF